jgi:hypothetical protein
MSEPISAPMCVTSELSRCRGCLWKGLLSLAIRKGLPLVDGAGHAVEVGRQFTVEAAHYRYVLCQK